MTITDASTGSVSYTWAEGDLATVGTYRMEFEITFSSGAIATVPNNAHLVLVVADDLGP